jgi:hypothetical protein
MIKAILIGIVALIAGVLIFAATKPDISKLMQVFFNMDKMVGTDFEAGLANLKAVAEKS